MEIFKAKRHAQNSSHFADFHKAELCSESELRENLFITFRSISFQGGPQFVPVVRLNEFPYAAPSEN